MMAFSMMEDNPVADDMLGVIGHHRKHIAHEVTPKSAVAQRGECDSFSSVSSAPNFVHSNLFIESANLECFLFSFQRAS